MVVPIFTLSIRTKKFKPPFTYTFISYLFLHQKNTHLHVCQASLPPLLPPFPGFMTKLFYQPPKHPSCFYPQTFELISYTEAWEVPLQIMKLSCKPFSSFPGFHNKLQAFPFRSLPWSDFGPATQSHFLPVSLFACSIRTPWPFSNPSFRLHGCLCTCSCLSWQCSCSESVQDSLSHFFEVSAQMPPLTNMVSFRLASSWLQVPVPPFLRAFSLKKCSLFNLRHKSSSSVLPVLLHRDVFLKKKKSHPYDM